MKHQSVVWALAITVFSGLTTVFALPGESLKDLIDKLRAVPAVDPNIYGYVPEDVRGVLIDFKEEVGRSIAHTVSLVSPDETPTEVRSEIIGALKKKGVVVGSQPDPNLELGYGYVPKMETKSLGRGILAVLVTFAIPCSGSDTTLYVFRFSRESWSQVLLQERSEFGADIAGGQGAFEYRASAPDSNASILILTTFALPHCTSVWHPLIYNLYRIAPSFPRAVLLASGSTDAIAMDEGYQITSDGLEFDLSYVTYSLDEDRFREVLHFVVNGNQVQTSRSRSGS